MAILAPRFAPACTELQISPDEAQNREVLADRCSHLRCPGRYPVDRLLKPSHLEQSASRAIQRTGYLCRRTLMTRRTIFAGALVALALGTSSSCFAQGAGSDINIATEQRTRIKDYVLRERVAPVTVRERIAVGA